MIITIRGKKYRLSPGLTRFVCGFQQGFGWTVALCAVLFIFWAFIMAGTHYILFH